MNLIVANLERDVFMSLSKRGNAPKAVREGVYISRDLSDIVFAGLKTSEKKGVDPYEFHLGMNIEMEHFDVTKGDLKKTAKITLAHLRELPDYNTRLKRMEKEGEKLKKKRKGRHPTVTFLFDDEDD